MMRAIAKQTIKIGAGYMLLCLLSMPISQAQDTLKYTGEAMANVDYHHGQLTPAIGVHNIQVFRANREFPNLVNGHNFTYNHQPFIAYWNDTYYLQFLSNPVGEHVAEGKTLLQQSKDGYNWTEPEDLFPPYKVPEGFTKPNREDKAGKDLYAIMHQRMGFFVSKNDKLLTIGYYGVALDAKDDPNDGNGIGRVVREIKKDGSFGPIYFIRFNSSFDQDLAEYPFYTQSDDKEFIEACEELLGNSLMLQQWIEEADRNDPIILFKRPLKAFSYYKLDDGRIVGLWKHALTSVSPDSLLNWDYPPLRAPGVVNSNAKIWGQRTSDGKFATAYNPSEFRWPLAVSTSEDGLNYTNLLLLNGEISTMRYGGNYKSYGPQYVRGILPGNGDPKDGNMWLTYSMNKEDMWVAKVPLPVTEKQIDAVEDDFSASNARELFNKWNIYSPLWAKVELMEGAISLSDKDRYDYGKAERVIPSSAEGIVEFAVTPKQNEFGNLQIELLNEKGQAATRITFSEDGYIKIKTGYREGNLLEYKADVKYNFTIHYNTATRSYEISVNDKKEATRLFFQPVKQISRVAFRTGSVRTYPDANTPTDQNFDVENPGVSTNNSNYQIHYFKAKSIK